MIHYARLYYIKRFLFSNGPTYYDPDTTFVCHRITVSDYVNRFLDFSFTQNSAIFKRERERKERERERERVIVISSSYIYVELKRVFKRYRHVQKYGRQSFEGKENGENRRKNDHCAGRFHFRLSHERSKNQRHGRFRI